MKSYQATWEDEENNRHVELVVGYQLDQATVDIANVTPRRVTFLCPTHGTPVRTVGVWTESGRRHLARQVEAAGRLATLPQEIAAGQLVELKHDHEAAAPQNVPVLQA
jgi:hypothetical protein